MFFHYLNLKIKLSVIVDYRWIEMRVEKLHEWSVENMGTIFWSHSSDKEYFSLVKQWKKNASKYLYHSTVLAVVQKLGNCGNELDLTVYISVFFNIIHMRLSWTFFKTMSF